MLAILVGVCSFTAGILVARKRPRISRAVFDFMDRLRIRLFTGDEAEENRLMWEACEWLVTTEKGKALLASLARESVMPLAKAPKSPETLAFDAGRASVVAKIVMWGLRKNTPERKQNNGRE